MTQDDELKEKRLRRIGIEGGATRPCALVRLSRRRDASDHLSTQYPTAFILKLALLGQRPQHDVAWLVFGDESVSGVTVNLVAIDAR